MIIIFKFNSQTNPFRKECDFIIFKEDRATHAALFIHPFIGYQGLRSEMLLWGEAISQVVLFAQEGLIVVELSQVNLVTPLEGALAVEAVVILCDLVS